MGAALGVLAIAGAVLLIDPTSGPSTESPAPVATSSPSATLTPPVRLTTVDEFCASFSRFAEAYSALYSASGDAKLVEAVGTQLLTVGRPPGMSDIEARGLTLFVEDAVEAVATTSTAGDDPESATRSSDDLLALETFNSFLTQTCAPT